MEALVTEGLRWSNFGFRRQAVARMHACLRGSPRKSRGLSPQQFCKIREGIVGSHPPVQRNSWSASTRKPMLTRHYRSIMGSP